MAAIYFMNYKDLKYIGIVCRDHRESIPAKQLEVSHDLKVSQQLISNFEHGYANNAIILMWYLQHGLTADKLIRNFNIVKGMYEDE